MDAVYDVQSLTNSSSSNPRTPSPVLPHDDLRFAYMPDSFDHHPPEPLKDHQPRYWQGSAPGTASASNPGGASSASIPVPTNGSAGARASAMKATAKTANGPFLNEYLNENGSVASDDALYPGYFRADWALSAPAHDSSTTTPTTTTTTATAQPQQTSTQPLSTTTPPHLSASPQSVRLQQQDHHHHQHQHQHQHHPGLYRGQSYPAAHQEHDVHHRPPLAQAQHHQHHQHQHQHQHHQHQHQHHHQQQLHHPHQYHAQQNQQTQQTQQTQHPQYPTQQHQHQHQLQLQHQQQQQQQHHLHLQQQQQQQQHNPIQSHPSLMAAANNPQDASKYVHSDHHLPPQSACPVPLHHGHNHDHQPFSVHPPPADHDHDSVKLEHTSMVVPSQLNHHHYYRPGSSSSSISNVSSGHPPPTYIPSTMSTIPIMHTDDAASKETQYLRRKCFNCQTTEPPSWRRSTLNPGKIVCNKCGLYERTHNKPRPHQFGLRPGNKARKQSKPAHDAVSPKVRHGITVKKDIDYARRGSVNGEWDDGYGNGNGAMYPTLGMHPPAARTHHHHPYAMPPPHQHHHQSGGIRLPQAPPMTAGMMSNSTPDTPYGSLPPSASVPAMYGNQLRGAPVAPTADYFRRGSVTPDMSGGIGPVRRHTVSTSSPGGVSVGAHQSGMQDMSWQHHPVPLSEMSVTPAPALANIGSAGSTPRKLLNGNGTPPPIIAPNSAGGSPSSAASAGAPVNALTPAVAPTESARAAVTA